MPSTFWSNFTNSNLSPLQLPAFGATPIKYLRYTGLFRSLQPTINPWSREQKALRSRLRRARLEVEERRKLGMTGGHTGLSTEEGPQYETESDITNAVEMQIEEAMRRGSFDNLPNKGRPLPRGQPRSTLEFAMRIMRDNGLRPHWLQLMHDIDHDRRLLRTTLTQAWQRHMPHAPHHWAAACRVAEIRIQDINARVDTFNLSRPFSFKHLFRLRLRLDDEMQRAMHNAAVLEADSAKALHKKSTNSPYTNTTCPAQNMNCPSEDGPQADEPQPAWKYFTRFIRATAVREYERPTWGRRRTESATDPNPDKFK